MKCGIDKANELTFEQPEEIAFSAKVKPDGPDRYTDFEPGAFCTKESGTAGIFPVFRFFRRTGFFYVSLV